MHTFIIDKLDNQYIKQGLKGMQYIMPEELVNLYDKLNKTGQAEHIQLVINEKTYEFDLLPDSFSLISKNFTKEKLVLIFPPCREIGVIRHYQINTFVITEDQKTYPHGDANEIQINMPEELNELYQRLSQKGRGLTIPISLEIDDQSFNFELYPHQCLYHKTLKSDEANIHITLQFQEKGNDWDSGILIRKFPKTKETTKKKKQKNHRTYEDYQKEYDLLSYMHDFSWAYIQQSENLALKESQKDINDLYQKYVSRLQKKCLKNTGKELVKK